VRVPAEGFQFTVPGGWRVQEQLTGPVSESAVGATGTDVVGVVLGPRSEPPREATITVTAAGGNELWDAASSKGSKRRADGRRYLLRPGSGPREVGRYLIEWPDFCPSRPGAGPSACRRMSFWPRVLVVTGVAAPGDAAGRQQQDGMGGLGRAPARRRRLRHPLPLGGAARAGQGVAPGVAGTGADRAQRRLSADGLPGLGPRLRPAAVGLAPEQVATARIELAGRQLVTTPSFGRDKPVPWVAFVSPPLPACSRVDRVVALDGAGTVVGSLEQPYPGALCRPRRG